MKKRLLLFLSILVLVMPVMVFAEPEESTTPTEPSTTEPEATQTPTQTPEPSVTPSPSPSPSVVDDKIDLTLKGVRIPGAELITPFSSDNSKVYEVKITDQSKFNLQYVTVDYTTKSDKLKFWVTQLDGQNTFKVFVQNKDNSKQQLVYTFKVLKEEANANLASLKINGYAFNETFDKDTTSYTVTVPYDITTVTITANPEDNNAKVNPSTSFTKDDLKVGGNTVEVKVTNGNSTKTYKIFITRSEENEVEEKATSIISSKITSSDFDIPKTENPDSILKYIIITLGSLVLFTIGGIGIYFFIKTSPKKMKKELLKEKEKKDESPIVESKPEVKEEVKKEINKEVKKEEKPLIEEL